MQCGQTERLRDTPWLEYCRGMELLGYPSHFTISCTHGTI